MYKMEKEYLSFDEIKQIALKGLRYLDQFCRDNSLRYYLAYGSLLGAVRHKGFIPWDDDIDVLMPREDYEKLLLLSYNIKNSDWELLSFKTNSKYCFPWAKLCNMSTEVLPSRFCTGLVYGISIDIFPLDFVNVRSASKCKKLAEQQEKRYNWATDIIMPFGVKTFGIRSAIKRGIKGTYYSLFGKRRLDLRKEYLHIEENIKKYNDDSATYAFYFLDRYRSVWRVTDFEDGEIHLIDFEGYSFRVPALPENVLEQSYGDYMKLPPEEKRVPIHSYKARYIK